MFHEPSSTFFFRFIEGKWNWYRISFHSNDKNSTFTWISITCIPLPSIIQFRSFAKVWLGKYLAAFSSPFDPPMLYAENFPKSEQIILCAVYAVEFNRGKGFTQYRVLNLLFVRRIVDDVACCCCCVAICYRKIISKSYFQFCYENNTSNQSIEVIIFHPCNNVIPA